MSTTMKHWLDVLAGFLTALSAVAVQVTPLISFLTAVAGLGWYGVRYYDRFVKGKKDGDK